MEIKYKNGSLGFRPDVTIVTRGGLQVAFPLPPSREGAVPESLPDESVAAWFVGAGRVPRDPEDRGAGEETLHSALLATAAGASYDDLWCCPRACRDRRLTFCRDKGLLCLPHACLSSPCHLSCLHKVPLARCFSPKRDQPLE